MNEQNHVLLASHGTAGAMAAEQEAIRLCKKGGHLYHLIVVPEFWEGMTGDDWLQNGTTRNTFRRYLEGELSREVDENIERVSKLAEEHALQYTSKVVIGEPTKSLMKEIEEAEFDLIVMGSRRPKGVPGLRSRMSSEDLQKRPDIQLLVVAYPELTH